MNNVAVERPRRGRPRNETPNPAGSTVLLDAGAFIDVRAMSAARSEPMSRTASYLIETHPEMIRLRREMAQKAAA